MTKLRIALVVALMAGLLGAAVPAEGAPVPSNATWTQVWFPSEDGTMLHADVFLPADRKKGERHPVILSVGPYFGSGGVPPSPARSGPVLRFNDLITEGEIFERGYAYIQVDSRGFGGSEGCNDLGGPGEQMDSKAAVEWAAKQKWSNGRVGMWGKSYDAWTQVLAMAHRPKGLAAAVIQSPLIEAYRGMYMNGIHYTGTAYAAPGLYAGYDLAPPSAMDSPPEEFIYPATGTASNPDCYAENAAMTMIPDREIPYWQERDVVKAASKSDVPVIWSHGFLDANTPSDNFLDVYSKLRGPKRAWFGQYDHVRGNEAVAVGRQGFIDEAMAWFEHYLKGKPLVKYPNVEIQDNEGEWRTEAAWPPSDARGFDLKVKPGMYVDQRGNAADTPTSGTWSFTQAAPYDLHFAGEPKLELELSTTAPNANAIALLYDVDPDGKARLITRGGSLVSEAGKVALEFYPQDWKLRKGHRFGLFISGSDESWFSPLSTGTPVTVDGGSLSLPFLTYERRSNLDGWAAQAMSNVPTTTLENSVIDDNTIKVQFPPRLRRR